MEEPMAPDYQRNGSPEAPGTNDRLDHDLREQVVQLRAELQELAAQVEDLVRARFGSVADVTNRAEEAVLQAKDVAREKIKDIAEEVRERPLVALLIAAAVGYVTGRVHR
jgi:ElaB/YqjD/DUF883 family membrane-anchored ribosome-binding protein